jgi:hypothetical protein
MTSRCDFRRVLAPAALPARPDGSDSEPVACSALQISNSFASGSSDSHVHPTRGLRRICARLDRVPLCVDNRFAESVTPQLKTPDPSNTV